MTAPLHVVVLAAGEGKRMKSALPKVLQKIAGVPMLTHVIASARALGPAGIHMVYGHGGDQVRTAFAEQPDLHWAEQAQQLGTGHAVQQAMPCVPDDARVLVLYGDVPLIRSATLQRLLDAPGPLAVLAAEFTDPAGYGRIVRDAQARPVELRVTLANGQTKTLLSAAAYYPFGPVSRWTFGNGRTLRRSLNQNYQIGRAHV